MQIFHLLGKVLYNKRVGRDGDEVWLPGGGDGEAMGKLWDQEKLLLKLVHAMERNRKAQVAAEKAWAGLGVRAPHETAASSKAAPWASTGDAAGIPAKG